MDKLNLYICIFGHWIFGHLDISTIQFQMYSEYKFKSWIFGHWIFGQTQFKYILTEQIYYLDTWTFQLNKLKNI